MTPEEMMDKILQQQDQIKEYELKIGGLEQTKTNLEGQINTLNEDIAKVRQANMDLFSRVFSEPNEPMADETLTPPEPKSKEPTSWDDFLKDWE